MSLIRGEQITGSVASASYATTASYSLTTKTAYGSYYESSTQPLPNGGLGMLTLTNVDFQNGITLGGTNNIYIPESGIYNFQIKVTVSDNTNADTINFILMDYVYGQIIYTSAVTVSHISSNPALISWSCLANISSGANVQLLGSCSGGNTSTTIPNNGGYPLTINVTKIA